MKRFATCVLVLTVILVSFSSCPPVSGPVTRYLTGTIRDMLNGNLLSGVNVSFGSTSTTTDVNGRFSIPLGTGGGNITNDLSIYKDNYQGYYIKDLTADASNNIDIIRSLFPYNSSSYPQKTVSGKIYSSGGSEITDPNYRIKITAWMPTYGQGGYEIHTGAYSGGYSITTRFNAADCIMTIETLNAGSQITNVMATTGNNLSGTDPITNKNFTFPATEIIATNVNLQGGIGNIGAMFLQDPGIGAFKSGSIYREYIQFSDPPSQTLDVVASPIASLVFWLHTQYESPSYTIARVATGNLQTFPSSSSTIILPSFVIGDPAGEPAYDLISYNNIDGTLSIPAVSSTNMYTFEIYCDEDGGGLLPIFLYGTIITPANSVVLPQWLQNRIAGRTITVHVRIGNFTNYFTIENYEYPIFVPYGGCAPGVSGTEMYSTTYYKEITVP